MGGGGWYVSLFCSWHGIGEGMDGLTFAGTASFKRGGVGREGLRVARS